MSHHATNWAIQQRGLQPATKLVLWYLADRHNPDFGCFPSQAQLAADCEMARGTLNRHLDELERRGLIRREPRIDPVTKRQKTTRYVLAFELDFARAAEGRALSEPCVDDACGNETNSEQTSDPCPDLRHGDETSRVSFPAEAVSHSCETRITSKGTSNDEERAYARACDAGPAGDGATVAPGPAGAGCEEDMAGPAGIGTDGTRGVDGAAGSMANGGAPPADRAASCSSTAQRESASWAALVARICEALGEPGLAETRWWRIEADFGRRIDAWRKLGLDDDAIVATARTFGRDVPEPPNGPKALDAAMVRAAQRITGAAAAPAARRGQPLPDGVRDAVDLLGRAIAEGRYVPPSAVTPGAAWEMMARGLVTAEQLQARGIAA
ncbi:MAG: helix-turn-helix domain-containing protein [Tabrizicola sp.]